MLLRTPRPAPGARSSSASSSSRRAPPPLPPRARATTTAAASAAAALPGNRARVAIAAAAAAGAASRRCPPRSPRCRSTSPTAAESVCYTGTVTWDNDASEDCTVLSIDAAEYDGLLRVIAWVLYGLQLRVRAAVLRSSTAEEDEAAALLAAAGGAGQGARPDTALGRALSGPDGGGGFGFGGGMGGGGMGGGMGGSVTDVFWVTDRLGRKLSDRSADGVAERLQEFISTCAPDEDAGARFEAGLQGWECSGGGIHATNASHPLYTQLTVTADDYSPGLVLEMTSVIAGMGVAVREAVVRSGGTRATLARGGGGGSGSGSENSSGGGGGGGGNGSAAGAGTGGGGAASAARPAAPPPSPPLGMEPAMAAEISRALETLPEPPPGKRVLRFWLYDRAAVAAGKESGKLSFSQVQALLYCIGLATGKGNLSTTPPNKTITGCACSPVPPVVAAHAAHASLGGRSSGGGGATTTAAWTTGDESS